ncbi:unnamed protein product [Vicia faba]|uniref:DUF3475 domain-containing protein n=1 Tax=Vicia faba TaxID=3906 RepID=A0AAV1AD29_VICFA|nr:unnamed protein product [Vicia faba]
MGEKQISGKGSLLSKASYRAVEVLDSLGSSMPKLNNSSGFVSGMNSKGKKISILAFEVANTITKGAILFHALYEENIQFLKREVLQSEGIQQLVLTDMKELISLSEMDKSYPSLPGTVQNKHHSSKGNIRIAIILASVGAAVMIAFVLLAYHRTQAKEFHGRSEFGGQTTGGLSRASLFKFHSNALPPSSSASFGKSR